MRISDWSSDVCSSDLDHIKSPDCLDCDRLPMLVRRFSRSRSSAIARTTWCGCSSRVERRPRPVRRQPPGRDSRRRSEEHTSELPSLMRLSYAVICLNKKIEPESNIEKHKTHRKYIA